jgi:formylglycine-generating enzyme required for sulfatase activity/dienelactone hydrolase/predicted Ser/Thr protein kinase
MEGELVSHYRVLEKLGGGGMGVVYKAEDVRLGRFAALKFLPHELTRDEDARQRFAIEAKAASALDHPNICTIYEVGTTDDGQMFMAMAFYDGETLKKRIERGALGVEEAVKAAIAIAQGLSRAHESGIIHRDIKPANVMVTGHGETKILDFGIAKLRGQSKLTKTGSTIGTTSYMAPEQLTGDAVDQRCDLWSLGVVLYEMLAGQPPFRGEHEPAIINGILNSAPVPLRQVRPEVPEAVEAAVNRATAKDPNARYASAEELIADLSGTLPQQTGPHQVTTVREVLRMPRVSIPALAVLLVLGGVAIWSWRGSAAATRARSEIIPEIERLVQSDEYVAAFDLAELAERSIPDDPALQELWLQIARTVTVETSPTDAEVAVAYDWEDGEADWHLLGRSQVDSARLPREAVHLRVEKAGFDPVVTMVGLRSGTVNIELDTSGTTPHGMVRVSAGIRRILLAGFDNHPPLETSSYLIDKHEVTNAEFKEFVDAGGYRDEKYWTQQFIDQGREVAWAEAMDRFRDRSGRTGPATWEGGTYPAGLDHLPVAGVSWYEAAAYAEFRGRSLPTVFHWLGATNTSLAKYVLPVSNFSGNGLRTVGGSPPGPRGTQDMAGNVKEWCWNETGLNRYILGGAWNEPTYMFFEPDARSPFDRSENNGFRTVDYLGTGPEELQPSMQPIEREVRDYRLESPASDEVYRAYAAQFSYDSAPLNVNTDRVDESSPYWRREVVSFDAAYGGERVVAHMFIPRDVPAPYQAVVYFPGSGATRVSSSDEMTIENIDLIVKSGRAVLWPVYKGSYERSTNLQYTDPNLSRSYVEHVVWWMKDLMRSVDYLETRSDVDPEKLAYYGTSWGARLGNIALAIEPRLRVGVLVAGGFPLMHSQPEVAEIHYAPHVTVPVLLVSGIHDRGFPYETSQKPMVEHLGTPEADKLWVTYEASHAVRAEFRSQVYQNILDWFDKYFGPVG